MKTIPLPRGLVCLVDEEDYDDVSRFKWGIDGAGYVHRQYTEDGKRRSELLHRRINKLTRGDDTEIDHRNGDKLDNRRENLRICSKQQNQRNVGLISTNKSGFKGVCKGRRGKWRAQIQVNKKQIYLGEFFCPKEAYAAYCRAAEKIHGEFANLGVSA
jgi:hypothetical protein